MGVYVTQSFTMPQTFLAMKMGILSNNSNYLSIDYIKYLNWNNFVNITEWNTPKKN